MAGSLAPGSHLDRMSLKTRRVVYPRGMPRGDIRRRRRRRFSSRAFIRACMPVHSHSRDSLEEATAYTRTLA